jgi:hypothetical protein
MRTTEDAKLAKRHRYAKIIFVSSTVLRQRYNCWRESTKSHACSEPYNASVKSMNVKRYIFGLAIGTFWLIAAGASFGALSLIMIGTPLAREVLVGETVLGGALCAVTIWMIMAVIRLPGGVGTPSPETRLIGRRFIRILAAELAAIFVVNGVLSVSQHVELIVPLDLIIVGIHFLPLARLFGVPRYTVMGVMFCAVCIATLLFVPDSQHIGKGLAWFVVPSLGCATAAVLIATGNLVEVWRFIKDQPLSLRATQGERP